MKEDQLTNNSIKKRSIAAWVYLGRFLIIYILVFSCNPRKDLVDLPLYEGPMSALDSAYTLVSDSGLVKMNLRSPRQNNFESGDQEWPQGMYVEWYNKRGEVTSFFSANYVYYTKADDIYHAKGNVIVKSNTNDDELNTEELFWDQSEEKFYTEKFVTIKSDGEVHTGEGLQSNQDFTEYRILKPSGTFTLEDDPNSVADPDVPLDSPAIDQ